MGEEPIPPIKNARVSFRPNYAKKHHKAQICMKNFEHFTLDCENVCQTI